MVWPDQQSGQGGDVNRSADRAWRPTPQTLTALLLGLLAQFAWPMAAWAVPAEAALGRLFFSPEERQQLDALRLGGSNESAPVSVAPQSGPSEPPLTGPRYVSLSGLLFNSNNRRVVWINGQPVETEERFMGEGFFALPGQVDARGLPVGSTDSGRLFYLKPGQTLDLQEGRLLDSYRLDPQSLKARRPLSAAPDAAGSR